MNQLTRASDWLSPTSRIFVTIATYVPAAVIFRPSWGECFVLCLVDFLILALLINPFEGRIFCWLYPECKVFFRQVDDEKIKKFDREGREKLLQTLMMFPKRRAIFMYVGSVLKNVPLMLIIVYYWHHGISNGMQFLLILGLSLISVSYFYAAVYFELHFFLSDLVVSLHKKHDFTDVFLTVNPRYSKRDLEVHDLLILLFIIFFVMVLQAVVVFSGDYQSNLELSLKLILIAFAGLMLFGHVWYLSRSFFIKGLEKLFHQMETLDYQQSLSVLALHTSPLLAQFEKTFNILVARLKSSEQELASFLFQEAEKSRYRAIGEMSALIAHDLSSPLHVAQFCIARLREDSQGVDSVTTAPYFEQLFRNVERAGDLVTSLKARLKGSAATSSRVLFLDAHRHAICILEMYYLSQGFRDIEFVVDSKLKNLTLILSQVELIQILDNIYRNSMQNILSHGIQNPKIKVSLNSQNNEYAEIMIEDNGTGLSKESFERLTSFQFTKKAAEEGQRSMGLRLTRRLIEYHGGSLNVVPFTHCDRGKASGTRILLRLRSVLTESEGLALNQTQEEVEGKFI